MEKTKLLTIAVIGLLVINLGTLSFLLMNGKGHRPPQGGRAEPKEVIIERLHLDAKQQKDYARLIAWHRGEIDKIDAEIRKAKNELYAELSQPQIDTAVKDSLISAINASQKQIEYVHFKHFEDIRKLCREDQIDDYNELTRELSRIFAPKPHGRKND